jgi:hypothetical protein
MPQIGNVGFFVRKKPAVMGASYYRGCTSALIQQFGCELRSKWNFAESLPILGAERLLLGASNPSERIFRRSACQERKIAPFYKQTVRSAASVPMLEARSAMNGFVSQGKPEKCTGNDGEVTGTPAPLRQIRARGLTRWSCRVGFAISCLATAAGAQVFTVETDKIESRFTEIKRTHVELSSQPVLQRTKLELVRVLEAEQGFAMRPLPKGSKGILLEANGAANPSGAEYVKSLEHNGIAFQAADRVVITDVKILPDRMVFELNGGPDKSHKILRHISIGAGGAMIPLARDNGQEPTGVRLTLEFERFVPEMTGTQVKELLEPLVDFKLKTPIQAYTDTLPPKLREAILSHRVLVGMSAEMVVYALGRPENKSREREGDMPFEEWIYGQPPKDVEFVRFNGNRVIQVEDCKLGEPPIIRNTDEMGDYWTTAPNPNIREVKLGDTTAGSRSSENAQAAPPTLKKPGETLPDNSNIPQMDKVQFPPGMDKSDGSRPAAPANTPSSGPATGSAPAPSPGPNNAVPAPAQYRAVLM